MRAGVATHENALDFLYVLVTAQCTVHSRDEFAYEKSGARSCVETLAHTRMHNRFCELNLSAHNMGLPPCTRLSKLHEPNKFLYKDDLHVWMSPVCLPICASLA